MTLKDLGLVLGKWFVAGSSYSSKQYVCNPCNICTEIIFKTTNYIEAPIFLLYNELITSMHRLLAMKMKEILQ